MVSTFGSMVTTYGYQVLSTKCRATEVLVKCAHLSYSGAYFTNA